MSHRLLPVNLLTHFTNFISYACALLICAGLSVEAASTFGYLRKRPACLYSIIDRACGYTVKPSYSDIQSCDASGRYLLSVVGSEGIGISKLRSLDGTTLPEQEDLEACELPGDEMILCRWTDRALRPKENPAAIRHGMTFCSVTGKVIDHDFERANRFSEHIAVCQTKDGAVVLVGKDGKVVCKSREFEFPVHGEFSEGLLAVRSSSGLWGYIDSTGSWKIPPQFRQAHSFRCSRALVQLASCSDSSISLTFIDRQGKCFAQGFNCAEDFSDGVAAVAVSQKASIGKAGRIGWGLIDVSGKWLSKPTYLSIGPLSDGTRSFLRFDSDDYGFIANSGKEIIAPRFRRVGRFSEGVCAVNYRGSEELVFVDKQGDLAISTGLKSAPSDWSPADHGRLSSDWPRFCGGLCSMPEADWRGFLAHEWPKVKWGYIDKTGKWAIRPQFLIAEDFHDGRAVVGLARR